MTSAPDSIHPYGTHMPALAAAVAMARPGPVLELGAGEFSTAMLHAICAATNRQLVTLDNDPAWAARFQSFSSGFHSVDLLASWDDIPDALWAVVFVDHGPAERRKIDIENLRDKCELIVVHDTEDDRYGYTSDLFASFTYRVDYKRLTPWTTILSMSRDLSGLADL